MERGFTCDGGGKVSNWGSRWLRRMERRCLGRREAFTFTIQQEYNILAEGLVGGAVKRERFDDFVWEVRLSLVWRGVVG